MRPIPAILMVAATIAGCAAGPRRLLCVVPQAMPDGTSSAEERAVFEQWLVDRAGGFTRMDSVEGAWRGPDGIVVREANHLYFVTVSGRGAAFEEELRARIVEDFDQAEAWVERR